MQRADGLIAVRGGQPVGPAPPVGPVGAWQWPSHQLRAAQ